MQNKPHGENQSWSPDRDDRGEYRLAGRVTVQLELEASDPGYSDEAQWVTCPTRDVSASGFKVISPRSLTKGALLTTRILLEDHSEEFQLVTEVMWTEGDSQGPWRAGLRILESDDPEVEAWIRAVARVLRGEGAAD